MESEEITKKQFDKKHRKQFIPVFVLFAVVFVVIIPLYIVTYSNVKSTNTNSVTPSVSVMGTSAIQATTTDAFILSAMLSSLHISTSTPNFRCPEYYTDSKLYNDDLSKLLKDYIDKNPKATATDLLTYRYSLLVKNNCKKTLDYIKSNAGNENPLNYFIENVQRDAQQGNSNLQNNQTTTEKSIADIVIEWQNRVAQVTCKSVLNGANVISQGSATLNNSRYEDGSVSLTAITNNHVVTGETGCILGIYGKGSRIITDQTAFMFGPTEDYAYINLDKASSINETTWKSDLSNNMKICSESKVNIGDNLIILGYPAIGTQDGITVTQGIVSGIEKDDYVTDAKIDHGNSGGTAVLIKDDCYLGIPSSSVAGTIESMGRILKANLVIN